MTDNDDDLDLDWDDDEFDWDNALKDWESELDRVTSHPPPPQKPAPVDKRGGARASASPFVTASDSPPLHGPTLSPGPADQNEQASLPEPNSLTPTNPEGLADLSGGDLGSDIDKLFDNLETDGSLGSLAEALEGGPGEEGSDPFPQVLRKSTPPTPFAADAKEESLTSDLKPSSSSDPAPRLSEELVIGAAAFTIPAPAPTEVDETTTTAKPGPGGDAAEGRTGAPSVRVPISPVRGGIDTSAQDVGGVPPEALALDHFPDPESLDLSVNRGSYGDTDPAPAHPRPSRPSLEQPIHTPLPAKPLAHLSGRTEPSRPIAIVTPVAGTPIHDGFSEDVHIPTTEFEEESRLDTVASPSLSDSPVPEEDDDLAVFGSGIPGEITKSTPARADESTPDLGAQAAKRTVKYRKPRNEILPLVGKSPEALQARVELLRALAEKRRGKERSRLLSAAATLEAELGNSDSIDAYYRQAREADPTDLVPLRALRKRALIRGEYREAAQLIELELKLRLAPEDKLAALLLLAELQRTQLKDLDAATRTARAALGVRRDSVAAALLLAELSAETKRPGDVAMALERAAEGWHDASASSTVFAMLARTAEGRGQQERARTLYERSLREAVSLEALLGFVRTTRGTGHSEPAIAGLVAGALRFAGSPTAERFLRLSALMTWHKSGAPKAAAAALIGSKQAMSQKTRSEAAEAAGDHETALTAAKAWAAASGGGQRARALVGIAEQHGKDGEWEACAQFLREATQADAAYPLLGVVRDVLSRKSGGTVQRTDELTSSSQDGMVSAAKLARTGTDLEQEQALLASAQESSITADTIWTDLCVASGHLEKATEGLRRSADRATGEEKLGPLLVLAAHANSSQDDTQERRFLSEAHDAAHGKPVVLRRMGQLLAKTDVAEAAECWMTEADHAPPDRAAFAAGTAGRLWARSVAQDGAPQGAESMETAQGLEKAIACYRRALRSKTGFWPALWYLEPNARQRGDFESVAELNEQSGVADVPPALEAARFVRAALLRADGDRGRAGVLLLRARELCPQDQVLQELLLRLGDGLSTSARAELLVHSAEVAPAPLKEPAWLRAAGAFEDAEEYTKAAEIYREIVSEPGGNPAAVRAYDRVQLRSGSLKQVEDRRQENVERAKTPSLRARALEDLAFFYNRETDTPDKAAEAYQQILEVNHGHIPSLRALERHHMASGDDSRLIEVERQLATQTAGTKDSTAHLRLVHRLALRAQAAKGTDADQDLLALADSATSSPWTAHRGYGAALARKDHESAARYAENLVRTADTAREAAAAALCLDDSLRRLDNSEPVPSAFQALMDRFGPEIVCREHPIFAERIARMYRQANQLSDGAEAFLAAAEGTRNGVRSARLYYDAGRLWEATGNAAAATKAYRAAAARNVNYRDVFDRLRSLLEKQEDDEAIIQLIESRILGKREPTVLKPLYQEMAIVELRKGNRKAARRAMRQALSLDPEDVPLLRQLATLSLEDQDWRGAAEPLIRIARVSRNREELKEVFFALGDLYDTHMPDAKRAEAAFRRVLKLDPQYLPAMERLANLYERIDELGPAAEVLKRLSEGETDAEKQLAHRLRVASLLERRSDLRRAETVLEEIRKDHPTNGKVIRQLADFYQRQDASPALSMHLKRAMHDLRERILEEPSDEPMWSNLIDVLQWRGRESSAAAVASASAAFGVLPPAHAPLVSKWAGEDRMYVSALSNALDDLLAPGTLSPVTVTVFKKAAAAFETCLPFSPRDFEAQKLSSRSRSIAFLFDAARAWGVRDLQLLSTARAQGVFAPVSASPTTILVDAELLAQAQQEESLFLLFRAIKIARTGLSVTVRSRPEQLGLAVAGLVRLFDADFSAQGIDESALQSMTDRMGKAVPRKVRDELLPLTMEMAGMQGFNPLLLGNAASELGNRAALTALGSLPAAFGALFRLAGLSVHRSNTAEVVNASRKLPETKALLEFALSDNYFEARQRLLETGDQPT